MQQAVVVDVYERESLVLDALRSLGVRCARRRLAVGDYLVGEVVVERKTVADLHHAIVSRRFWRQVARLRRGVRLPYLVVEGLDLDDGRLRPGSVRGALLALAELDVHVLRTKDPEDTALWLKLLAGRPKVRERQYRAPRARLTTPAESMLCAIPGISTTSARALLAHFGTVADIAMSEPSDWLSVPGIGPVRAASLEQALRQGRATPSCPRSGQRALST